MNNKNKFGKCWFCNKESLEKLMEPVNSVSYYRNSPVLICKSCGFMFKKPCVEPQEMDDDLKTAHYNSYTYDKLFARSKARALVDTNRVVEYINYIRETVDLNNVKRALDIGGAEGLFSKTLKTIYPDINVYCLEPDSRVVSIGKQLYPEVKFLEGRLENILNFQEKDFDLITYFGGFYRTVEPRTALQNLYTCMAKSGFVVFSLSLSLDNPGKVDGEPYDSLDELLVYSLVLDDYYMKSFLKECFILLNSVKRQNYPFLNKFFFYTAQKGKDISHSQIDHLDRYKLNKGLIFQYANEETKKRFDSLIKKNSLKNIAIFGVGPEAEVLSQIAAGLGVKVMFFIDPFCLKSGEQEISGIPVKLLSEIYHESIDALIIADYDRQNVICDQLKNRIRLDQRLLIIKGFEEKEYVNKRISFVHEGKIKLQKAFSFITLNNQ